MLNNRYVAPAVRNARSLFLGTLFFAFFTSQSSRACSETSIPTKIGRNFNVRVFDRGNPVEGLPVELSTDPEGDEKSQPVLTVKTDAKGSAHFKSVMPRLYYIGIEHPAFASSMVVQVMRRLPRGNSNTLTFQWPGWNPLSTQTVAGSLTGHARTARGALIDMTSPPVYSSVTGAKLTLSKAVSGEVVASQLTQEAGNFEFQRVPPGLYMLRVETPVFEPAHWIYPADGYVPIEVDPSSQFSRVNLELGNAICGELAWGRPKEHSR
jgi:hypothetical protein